LARSTSVKLPFLGEPGDKKIARQIKALVGKASSIVISGHERPDGDCIGSEVALCAILRAAGRKAEVVNSDPVPLRYQFLVPQGMIRRFAPNEQLAAPLVFVLDATDLRRLGHINLRQLGGAKIINLDHHCDNPSFGDINLVDPKASATGEVIWRVVAACGWKVPPLALEALYTALVTDTGQFSYGNTTSRSLRMAAELVELGVSPERIWRTIYLNRSAAELALEARARNSLELAAGGRIGCIALRRKDFLQTKTGSQHAEDLVGIPRSVAGVEMALFFYEFDKGRQTKVSIRTTPRWNASVLAAQFGGGGHRQAAGCHIAAGLPKAKIKFLAAARVFIRKGPAHDRG